MLLKISSCALKLFHETDILIKNTIKGNKKMKKTVLICIITIIICLAFSGCSHTHVFGDWKITKQATCTEQGERVRVCDCGEIQTEKTELAEHKWKDATCTEAKTCSVCNAKEGHSLGHYKYGYVCSRCGISLVTKNDIPNIIDITSLRYRINSVNGIDQHITFKNKSDSKTIKYIVFDVSFYNTVGDIAENEIGGAKNVRLQYIGPLKPGYSSGQITWDACFYCPAFSGQMKFNSIEIEYTDGSKITLNDSIAKYAVSAWR